MPQGHFRRPGDKLEDVDGAAGEGQGAAKFVECGGWRRGGEEGEQQKKEKGSAGGGQRPSLSPFLSLSLSLSPSARVHLLSSPFSYRSSSVASLESPLRLPPRAAEMPPRAPPPPRPLRWKGGIGK